MMSEGTLYIGYDSSGYFKIGITADARKRRNQIRTGNPTFGYLYVFQIDNPSVAELELHTKFEKSRVAGEWFALSAHDLKWIFDRFGAERPLGDFEKVIDKVCNQKLAANIDFIRGRK